MYVDIREYVEIHEKSADAPARKRASPANLDVEQRSADELLARYGRWAQDRYVKRTCASAEGKYVPPPTRGDEPMVPFMADFDAMRVQHALVVVPMQYRRVLHAYYIPQRVPHHAARRRLGVAPAAWERDRLEGLRSFWTAYRLRGLTRSGTIAPISRDTES